MADETANGKAPRAQRGKITLGDLGVPSLVKSMSVEDLAKNGGKYVMGRLLGKASGFVRRTNIKDGTEMEGLAGQFISFPSNASVEEIESGVLYIPDAFHNIVAAQLREAQKTDPNAEVEFAFEVSSIPAKNPAGYSWQFNPILEMKGAHPLSKLIGDVARVTAERQRQLAAPEKRK